MNCGWYKLSALYDDLSNIIIHHLRTSNGYANDAAAFDAISNRTQGVDNASILNSAINRAAAIISQQQGGMLTQPQQHLLNVLRSRIQDNHNLASETTEQIDQPFVKEQTEITNNNTQSLTSENFNTPLEGEMQL